MVPVGPLGTVAPELQASQAGKNSKNFPAFFISGRILPGLPGAQGPQYPEGPQAPYRHF